MILPNPQIISSIATRHNPVHPTNLPKHRSLDGAGLAVQKTVHGKVVDSEDWVRSLFFI